LSLHNALTSLFRKNALQKYKFDLRIILYFKNEPLGQGNGFLSLLWRIAMAFWSAVSFEGLQCRHRE
jgi:hypothetical protein